MLHKAKINGFISTFFKYPLLYLYKCAFRSTRSGSIFFENLHPCSLHFRISVVWSLAPSQATKRGQNGIRLGIFSMTTENASWVVRVRPILQRSWSEDLWGSTPTPPPDTSPQTRGKGKFKGGSAFKSPQSDSEGLDGSSRPECSGEGWRPLRSEIWASEVGQR